jgi:hypothetical protein
MNDLEKYIAEFDRLTERKSELLKQKAEIDEELGKIKHQLKVNEVKIHKLM